MEVLIYFDTIGAAQKGAALLFSRMDLNKLFSVIRCSNRRNQAEKLNFVLS